MYLILKANQIPTGTPVSKVTGSEVYTLKRSINLFLQGGQHRTIEAEDGTAFLVSKTGDISSFSGEKELKVDINLLSPNLYDVIRDCLIEWRTGIAD